MSNTAPRETATLSLTAKLTQDGPPIGARCCLGIFAEAQGPDGSRELVAERHGGSAEFVLKPGGYFVHCGFGYAGTTEHVGVGNSLKTDTIVLNAGGVRLYAVTGKDRPRLDKDDIKFDIFSQELDSTASPKRSPSTLRREPSSGYRPRRITSPPTTAMPTPAPQPTSMCRANSPISR